MERDRQFKNLKILSSLAKNKKNTEKQKINLGKNLIKTIQGMGCNPNKVLYQPGNKIPPLSIENSLSISKGTKHIGKGGWGSVYMGCIDKECKKPIAIKIVKNEPLEYEYKMGKRIQKFGAIKPFHFEKCENVSFMYTQYANNGTLSDYIKNNKDRLLPIHFRTIVTQVLYNLYKIHKKYPTFRHNDLHMQNILIHVTSPSRIKLLKVNNTSLKVHDIGLNALISDFGLSTLKGFKCPPIDDDPLWYKQQSGIYRGSHPMYDMHLFLNGLRTEIKIAGIRNGAEVIQFIERILPEEYIGKLTNKVFDWRLRATPLGHPKLPTFKQIFNDRFFSPYKKAIIPFDINTIINRKPPSKPKTITVKHGGPVKKTMEQIKRELAAKNNKPVVKRPIIRRPGIRVEVKQKTQQKINVSLAKKGYVKLGTKKCESYKKQELIKLAKSLGISTENKTIKKICNDIKLKYV